MADLLDEDNCPGRGAVHASTGATRCDQCAGPAAAPRERVVRVFAPAAGQRTTAECRGRTCRAQLWFAPSCATGRLMPFDGPQQPIRIETEAGTGRPIWIMNQSEVHFGNCPDAKRFSRRGSAASAHGR